MVQMRGVFLALKPAVAVIKHKLLIKISPVLFQDVQVHTSLHHNVVMMWLT